MATKQLTLLHSNDIHGDFLEETHEGGQVTGGIARLSGYVQAERAKNKNCIYAVAGDMLQGSLIDAEFRGLSTMDMMNLVGPDIACLGNHEFDYGLTHLLFLERCAKFPIVDANLFIKRPLTRLFRPYRFLHCNGMKIMFIGIITTEALAGISDNLIVGLVDVTDAAEQVGKICNRFRETDVDLTVLLTHIGIDEDRKLAELLDPAWGVDLIIGAHTHTFMEQPEVINGVIIAQAGSGSDQIGRFDLEIDTDTNSIADWTWELVPITPDTAPNDEALCQMVESYAKPIDEKYSRVLCRLSTEATHPDRHQETTVGDLWADLYATAFHTELALVGSGSLRKPSLGPVVTVGTALAMGAFGGAVYRFKATGAKVKQALRFVMHENAGGPDSHGEFFQLSSRLKVTWSRSKDDFEEILFDGKPLEDDVILCVAIEDYHHHNCQTSFGMSPEEFSDSGVILILATEVKDVYLEYFGEHARIEVPELGRLTIKV
ncbi:MAG: bifunctional metallophosphatase/5'-nucleotidase [Propionibacteriaceae bacterium]|jgi:5'-nucleotidase|nr:bifunctional metallophosphatase/5'-nucleotidase [Propionibacteriaceae bacterium]